MAKIRDRFGLSEALRINERLIGQTGLGSLVFGFLMQEHYFYSKPKGQKPKAAFANVKSYMTNESLLDDH